MAYKVYLNGKRPCSTTDAPDRERTFESLTIVDVVYVLLANPQHARGSRIGYKLQVLPARCEFMPFLLS
jgi:hypothetical protein